MRRKAPPLVPTASGILVADAEAKAGRTLAAYLCRRGFLASHTAFGSVALSVVRCAPLGMAIVDVALRDMSGYALTSQLRQHDASLPILMTSADHGPELEVRARRMGILYYAQKPVDYHLLEEVVTRVLGHVKSR